MTEEKPSNDFIFEKELLSPYNHIKQVKGKQLRVKIILAFDYWLKVPKDTLRRCLEIFDLLHHAGLLIDDIQDNSVVRRGQPAAHCVYGLPTTINASLQVILIALKNLMDLSHKAGQICAEQYLDVIRGQGVDIYWRENFICPTEAEYIDMVQRKTGASYLFAVRTLQLFSADSTDYTNIILLLGLYFQIRDDYCNLIQQEALEDWPGIEDIHAKELSFCEDLTEGKFSLPIIHALNTPQGPQVLNTLRQRTHDIEVKKYCISLLDTAGSLQYAREKLRELDLQIRSELVCLGGNPEMEAVLDELLTWQDQTKPVASG